MSGTRTVVLAALSACVGPWAPLDAPLPPAALWTPPTGEWTPGPERKIFAEIIALAPQGDALWIGEGGTLRSETLDGRTLATWTLPTSDELIAAAGSPDGQWGAVATSRAVFVAHRGEDVLGTLVPERPPAERGEWRRKAGPTVTAVRIDDQGVVVAWGVEAGGWCGTTREPERPAIRLTMSGDGAFLAMGRPPGGGPPPEATPPPDHPSVPSRRSAKVAPIVGGGMGAQETTTGDGRWTLRDPGPNQRRGGMPPGRREPWTVLGPAPAGIPRPLPPASAPLAMDPTGRCLAVAMGEVLGVWDLTTGAHSEVDLPRWATLVAMAWSADGAWFGIDAFASLSTDRDLVQVYGVDGAGCPLPEPEWSAVTDHGRERSVRGGPSFSRAIAVDGQVGVVLVGNAGEDVAFAAHLRPGGPHERHSIPVRRLTTTEVAISPDGSWVTWVLTDGELEVRRAGSLDWPGRVWKVEHDHDVRGLAATPAGPWLMGLAGRNRFGLWLGRVDGDGHHDDQRGYARMRVEAAAAALGRSPPDLSGRGPDIPNFARVVIDGAVAGANGAVAWRQADGVYYAGWGDPVIRKLVDAGL